MIQYQVECRVLTPKLKTATRTIKVKARDVTEAKARARQVFRQRGNNNVEPLMARQLDPVE